MGRLDCPTRLQHRAGDVRWRCAVLCAVNRLPRFNSRPFQSHPRPSLKRLCLTSDPGAGAITQWFGIRLPVMMGVTFLPPSRPWFDGARPACGYRARYRRRISDPDSALLVSCRHRSFLPVFQTIIGRLVNALTHQRPSVPCSRAFVSTFWSVQRVQQYSRAAPRFWRLRPSSVAVQPTLYLRRAPPAFKSPSAIARPAA